VRADAVHADWEKTSKQIHYIETETLKELNHDFDKSWSSLSKLMRQESEAAAKAAEACVVVKVRCSITHGVFYYTLLSDAFEDNRKQGRGL
jgi:hypothetical protein